jgi:hypothetical protein
MSNYRLYPDSLSLAPTPALTAVLSHGCTDPSCARPIVAEHPPIQILTDPVSPDVASYWVFVPRRQTQD